MQFSLIGNGDDQNITVFVEGQAPKVAHSSHPCFQKILDKAVAGDSEGILELFDMTQTTSDQLREFDSLSDRISVSGGKLFLDGDEIHNSLADQIVRFIKNDEDWLPLVNFYENLLANPSEKSREQLYTWLSAHDFTITEDGYILGCKGAKLDENGVPHSIHSGTAIVDGEEI